MPWMLSIALVPAAIGKAIDEGLVAHDEQALLVWSGAIMGLGLVSAVTTNGRHWFAVRNWLIASFRTAVVTERAVRRAGPALTRQMPAGEVVTSFASDFWRIGNAYDVTARMAGAIVSFVVVSIILLHGSVVLGVIMLVGGPVLLASLTLVMRPLQRRQAAQRHEAGLLTSLGADTVAGLRVLRGIGGEDTFLTRYAAQSGRVRGAGVRLSGIQATLDAAQVLLPGIFVVIVTGVGAHLAVAGEITPGQLVAFYGYTAFLTMPLRTATEFVDKLIRARVAARRVVHDPRRRARPRRRRADRGDPQRARASTSPRRSSTRSPASSSSPAGSPRWSAPAPRRPRSSPTGWAAPRPGRHGVRWGDVPLDDLPVDAVRSRVVVSEADPHLFSGPVREALGGASDDERHAAVWVTSASDALDALEHGMDGELEERGRALSGGQRQRVAAGACPAARPRGARAHRADQRGRRPHRGPDRRAARRAPRRAHHGARHREPAAARPGRHRRARRGRPGESPAGGTTTCCARTRPTATSCCGVGSDVAAARAHRPRRAHPAHRVERHGARAHQGAHARPPRAARRGCSAGTSSPRWSPWSARGSSARSCRR